MPKKPLRRPKASGTREVERIALLGAEIWNLTIENRRFLYALRDLLAFYDRGGNDGFGWTPRETLRLAEIRGLAK